MGFVFSPQERPPLALNTSTLKLGERGGHYTFRLYNHLQYGWWWSFRPSYGKTVLIFQLRYDRCWRVCSYITYRPDTYANKYICQAFFFNPWCILDRTMTLREPLRKGVVASSTHCGRSKPRAPTTAGGQSAHLS